MSTKPQSLKGLRILNTRPLEQGRVLSKAIEAAGGVSLSLPALTIEATSLDWVKQLPNLKHIQQIIFISANAVNYFFVGLETGEWIPAFARMEITAIGHATAAALHHHSITAHHIPSLADSEHLLMLDNLQHIKNQTILLVKGEQGRQEIEHMLRERGANLLSLAVYRRELPQINTEYIHSLWQDDAVDIILLTSEQAMHNLFTMFGPQATSWLCTKRWLVISQRLADAAVAFGVNAIIISPYDDLLNTLKGLANDDHYRNK